MVIFHCLVVLFLGYHFLKLNSMSIEMLTSSSSKHASLRLRKTLSIWTRLLYRPSCKSSEAAKHSPVTPTTTFFDLQKNLSNEPLGIFRHCKLQIAKSVKIISFTFHNQRFFSSKFHGVTLHIVLGCRAILSATPRCAILEGTRSWENKHLNTHQICLKSSGTWCPRQWRQKM